MGFVCLTYHRIADEKSGHPTGHPPHIDSAGISQGSWAISPARFAAQMAWLARRGWRGLSVRDALDEPGGRVIALSFDDGYADFLEEAWPVLRRHGFRATLFVVVGCLGETAEWNPVRGVPLLSAAQLRKLASAGVEIAAHGLRHRPLDGLSQQEAQREMALARRTLEQAIGCPVSGLAYPYGRTSESLRVATGKAGFRWAATARGGRNHAGTPRLSLRRTLIRDGDRLPLFTLKAITGYATLLEARMDLLRVP